jgi:hypothetical protein
MLRWMLIWCHRVFTAAVLLDSGWTRMVETGVANVQENAGQTQRDVCVVWLLEEQWLVTAGCYSGRLLLDSE